MRFSWRHIQQQRKYKNLIPIQQGNIKIYFFIKATHFYKNSTSNLIKFESHFLHRSNVSKIRFQFRSQLSSCCNKSDSRFHFEYRGVSSAQNIIRNIVLIGKYQNEEQGYEKPGINRVFLQTSHPEPNEEAYC